MSGFNLTQEQRDAIYSRGEAILVSAGAGSGKTRVLVERLMSRITDPVSPCDIDSFLIITFTRAAAAELRGRIAERLAELSAENPADRRLRRQTALCARAQIGTIHSFCTNILREHAHLIGLPPDFRVADESRAEHIKQLVLERVLEKAYERIDKDADFRALADTVGAGRDDRQLESVVLELYGKMSSHSYPERWAERCAQELELGGVSDAGETVWGRWLLQDAQKSALAWEVKISALLQMLFGEAGDAKIAAAYGESLQETADALRDFARAAEEGWDRALSFLPIPFPRLKALRNPENPELAERVKAQRELCKNAMKTLAERFVAPGDKILSDLRATAPAARALLRLCVDFDRAFAAEKRRQSMLDFSDLEHLSVRLLLDEESGAPTAAAREIAKRFTEIMVDEYQDVNAVQDAIFSAVSDAEKNLFMVGDVKQSIYRFRLADPTIFIRRYDAFATGDGGKRILLQHNFRSRPAVLDAVNHVFGSIMSRELGELDYDENAALIAGGTFPPTPHKCVTMTVVEPPVDDEDAPDAIALEAEAVARKIREIVDSALPITVGDGVRPARWGDIVILLRSPGSTGAIFRRALEAQGVPVSAEQGTDFFSAPEVAVMLHLLALADNPRQDLPLISVLRSELCGFSADELAAVRATAPGASFYTALEKHARTDEKSRAFLELLQQLRQDAEDLPLSAFLWKIYTRTDALAIAAAALDGAQRRENLLHLFELTQNFEESGYRGLGRFMRWIEQQRARGGESVSAPVSTNAVRVMSIHKSKGLEFPVVFLCGLAKKFNKRDTTAAVPVHAELGLGLKRMDIERGVEYPTLSRMAVARKLLKEGLSEEMRVLYVAMTRAKEYLHMSCVLRDPAKKLDKLRGGLGDTLAPCVLETASCPAEWLLQAAMLPQSPYEIGFASAEELETARSISEAEEAPVQRDEVPDLAAMLDYCYPHAAATSLPAKLTATEIKSRTREGVEDAEAQSLLRQSKPTFRMPAFGEAQALSGAARGTATHRLMQYIRFEMADCALNIATEVERLRAAFCLSDAEAEAVDVDAVERFFRSETGEKLRRSSTVLREQRFSVLLPAEDFYPEGAGEEILLQGVVDCCIEEEDGLVILDFKTDHVRGAALEERARDYTPQLRAYAKAMARMTGKKVKSCLLEFLFAGEEVKVPLS